MQRTCSKAGCLFGAPLPIPNPGTPAISICVVNSLSADITGTGDCSAGTSNISQPLNSEIFLTGDLDPAADGIQPCPVCDATNHCTTGPNAGQTCQPGSSGSAQLGPAFPTSHDCPPPPSKDIGGLPIGFNLSTGTVRWTGVPFGPAVSQARGFCGFCRDADDTGCFEGDPHDTASFVCGATATNAGVFCTPSKCSPPSAACECIGSSSCVPGTCPNSGANKNKPHKCLENGATSGPGISACSGTFESCIQRDQGAFGPGTGGVKTITEIGVPAGDQSDHNGHAATLVSVFCIPPTFTAAVDGSADLPGPGAIALQGTAQLN